MGVHVRNVHRRQLHANKDEVYKLVMKQKEDIKAGIPENFKTDFHISELNIGGFKCYNLIPNKNFTNKYIFYIYESHYCYNMTKSEWNFVRELAVNLGMGLMIPMYPLAPEYGCKDVFEMLLPAYEDLAKSSNAEKIYMVGNGSGGGLALSLMIQIWKNGLKKPSKLLLLSPSLDTEFFNKELEEDMMHREPDAYYISDGVKDFLNEYWVKEMATKTEFTSPIYEDITDICDEILLMSGTADSLNGYARHFYDKSLKDGLNIMYFEYSGKHSGFYVSMHDGDAEHAKKVIIDTINDNGNAIFDKYMYEVKQRSEWSKAFPEVFNDKEANKYLCTHKVNIANYKTKNEYRKLLEASIMHSFDQGVKEFLNRFPNGTVVYTGCSLDTMFERTDNGRVLWYNCDKPGKIAVRKRYVTDKDREKTVARTLSDSRWLSEIKCNTNQGLLFVFRDNLSYLKNKEVKKIVEELHKKFPGCEILFDVARHNAMLFSNFYNKKNDVEYYKKKFYLNDTERSMLLWNTSYNVLENKSIFNDVEIDKKWNGLLKLHVRYSKKRNNYKIVHVRLGKEKYTVDF